MHLRHVLKRLAIPLLLSLIWTPALAAATAPPAFLDQIEGTQAMDWVRAQNAHTASVLQADPAYAGLQRAALAVAQSHDRIPEPILIGDHIYNLWQDQTHRHGILRATSLAGFRQHDPDWRTVLDLDALSATEHRNWVFKAIDCLEPADTRCLLTLSDGGGDADTIREFDLSSGAFVANGFVLPTSKQTVAWEDADTLLVARDWGPMASGGSMTKSGYPFIVKRLHRGQPLDQARTVATGAAADISDEPVRLTDGTGRHLLLIHRGLTFFTAADTLVTPSGLLPLDLPPKSTVIGLVAGRIVFKLDQDWQPKAGPRLAGGSLAAIDADHPQAAPSLIFAPGPTQSVEAESVGVTRNGLIAAVLDNVQGGATLFRPDGAGWQATKLALPTDIAVKLVATDPRSDQAFVEVTGFLTPSQLWQVDTAAGHATRIKALPAQFDASRMVVEQLQATSTDGTKIPYFIVHRRDLRHDGVNPTELTAYGGFGVSNVPSYSGAIGRLWLSQGGVYALANIRGGGEFGPAWHEAGRKTDRQRVFDDFAAVGRDLIARRITDAAHLGIRGRSNGGLLMGVEFTQHPELWRAVIIGVPLLDMHNFETMAAGASWVDEYGSQSVPGEAAFLDHISPLQALRPGVAYPEPFIFTSTQDDRVGPVHARRFAWRLHELGIPFLYEEDTEGGHSGTANLDEVAHEQALEAVYLHRRLEMTGR